MRRDRNDWIKINKFVCAANKSVIYEECENKWQILNTGAVWNRLADVIWNKNNNKIPPFQQYYLIVALQQWNFQIHGVSVV